MKYAVAVTFQPLATGQIQLLRTGSGFWRWDHGARFSIDKALLSRILKNTQLRARPLRMDFMHWANGDEAEGLGDLMKAGEVNPSQIYMAPWRDPSTGAKEFGLFAPCVWETIGADAVYRGLDEISPVIEWEYALPFDVIGADGAIVPAGTLLGPTITGLSLVDQGFFWMSKVRTYSASHGAKPFASLYQETTAMILNPEQLAAFLTWATDQGWEETVINAMVAAATAEAAAEEEPAPAPDMAAGDPAAASQVMAARNALAVACRTGNATKISAAQKVYAAALAKAGKRPGPIGSSKHPLAELLAAASKARSTTTTRPTPPAGSQAANYSAIEEQLAAQKEITDQLMFKELEREGLLVGIDDPMELYKQAPSYFMKKVQGNVSLVGSTSPAGPNRSGLRDLRAVENDEGEAHHRAITAYRAAQLKAGHKLTYEQAMLEWEELENKKDKDRRTLTVAL